MVATFASRFSILIVPVLAAVVLGVIGFLANFSPFQTALHEDVDWQTYKAVFVTGDGRVLDNRNNNVSHSEGQGWGMLLAYQNGDRRTFERMWQWVRTHIQVRDDNLFAWRWLPNAAGNQTPDLNDASDGDLYIAWALLRAGNAWGEPRYLESAKSILIDVRQKLIRRYAGETVMLPGTDGFEHDGYLLLNLSYWIFPAFKEFYLFEKDPVWIELRRSGINLITRARFGQWRLPPDWLVLTNSGQLRIDRSFPPRFGYDALRVPLALYWGGVEDQSLFEPFSDLYKNFIRRGALPAWIDLNDGSIALHNASEGLQSVMALAYVASTQSDKPPALPRVSPAQDYYTASLIMLARQAMMEVESE